jgi:hypothetical protein
MAKIQIIFTKAAIAEAKANSIRLGKFLPDNFLGPTFENAELGAVMNGAMVGVQPDGEESSYLYNPANISRIKITNKSEQVTDSGIVVVKPRIIAPK